jgi:hypothetical protein
MEKGAAGDAGVENAQDVQRGVELATTHGATARSQRRQRRPLFSAEQLRSFLQRKAFASASRPPGGADGHGNAADLAEVDSPENVCALAEEMKTAASNQVPLSDAELDKAIATVQTLAGPASTLDWSALRKLMAEGGASCRLAPSGGAARASQCPSSAGVNVPQCSFPDSSRPVLIPGGECTFQGLSADDGQASCALCMQSRLKTVHRPDKGNLYDDGEESECASMGEAHDVDNPAPTSVQRGKGPGTSHGDGDVAQRLEFESRPSATKDGADPVKRRAPEQDHSAEPSLMDEEVSKKICVGSDAAREQLCGHGTAATRDGFGVSDSLRPAPETQQDRVTIGKSPVVDEVAPKASAGVSSQVSSRASDRGERMSDEEKEAEAVDEFDNASMHDGCDVDPPHEEEAPPRADHSPGESSRPDTQGRTEASAAIKAKKPSKLKLRSFLGTLAWASPCSLSALFSSLECLASPCALEWPASRFFDENKSDLEVNPAGLTSASKIRARSRACACPSCCRGQQFVSVW